MASRLQRQHLQLPFMQMQTQLGIGQGRGTVADQNPRTPGE
jgi:hypothetical protein